MADAAVVALLSKSRVFTLPSMQTNTSGWGPTTGPTELADVPYAPFQKDTRLGRVSDWMSNKNFQNNRGRSTFGAGTGAFGYTQEFQESDFALVDNTPRAKPRDGRRRFTKFSIHNKRRRGRGFGARRFDNGRGRGAGRGRGGQRTQPTNRWGQKRWGQQDKEPKRPSVPIQETWELCSSLDLAELGKIALRPPVGRDLVTAGRIEKYNDNVFGSITPKHTFPLNRFEDREFITASTSEDPILQRLKAEGKGTVFATDTILAVLMSAGRSVMGWDLIVSKKDGVIVIDKRPTSIIDYLTVNENWNEVQETDTKSMNHFGNLCREATMINHNFSQEVLDKRALHELQEPNPFTSLVEAGTEPASMGYRYRQHAISDEVTLVSRCEVNAYTESKNGDKSFLTVLALNDFDHNLSGGVDWRKNLHLAPAQVLASEMKNNNCKLAKFASKLELAGTDELRLGFVTRKKLGYDNALSHEVLLVRKFKPDTFTHQLQMQTSNLWASLKRILDMVFEQEDGQFVLLKDPNDPKLHLYKTPEGPIEGADVFN